LYSETTATAKTQEVQRHARESTGAGRLLKPSTTTLKEKEEEVQATVEAHDVLEGVQVGHQALVTPEDLGPGAEVVGEDVPELLHRRRVATQLVDPAVERHVVGRPVALGGGGWGRSQWRGKRVGQGAVNYKTRWCSHCMASWAWPACCCCCCCCWCDAVAVRVFTEEGVDIVVVVGTVIVVGVAVAVIVVSVVMVWPWL